MTNILNAIYCEILNNGFIICFKTFRNENVKVSNIREVAINGRKTRARKKRLTSPHELLAKNKRFIKMIQTIAT